jgi:hypothetical protein
MWKASLRKTINHRRTKYKKTTEDAKITCAHGLVESILRNWLYYQKQSTFSMQFLSKFKWHSSQGVENQTLSSSRSTSNTQGNTEQKEQWWKYHTTWHQAILQSHNNKNSMILAQKQIWRLVKQNRRLK